LKLLMPFWQLYSFPRYLPELKVMSERLDSFYIAYIEGTPKETWKCYLKFRKVHLPFSFVKSKVLRFLLSRKHFYTQVKDIDADLIYNIGGTWEQEVSRYLSKKMGIPYIVRLRGDLREVRRFLRTNLLKAKVLDCLDVRSLKQADLVIPISRALADKIKQWGIEEDKIAPPIPGGVDTKMFKPMKVERSSEFTVGYAGRLSLEKGILRLLKLAKKLKDTHFIVAGYKEVNVSFPNNVDYYGWLSYSEMPAFYNKADLIILPSMTEGFPYVILEAYACEKPVLATPEAFPEELEIFGSIAKIEDFTSEIDRLKNSNLKIIGRKAREYVKKHFTWKKFGELMTNLLKEVVSNPSSN